MRNKKFEENNLVKTMKKYAKEDRQDYKITLKIRPNQLKEVRIAQQLLKMSLSAYMRAAAHVCSLAIIEAYNQNAD